MRKNKFPKINLFAYFLIVVFAAVLLYFIMFRKNFGVFEGLDRVDPSIFSIFDEQYNKLLQVNDMYPSKNYTPADRASRSTKKRDEINTIATAISKIVDDFIKDKNPTDDNIKKRLARIKTLSFQMSTWKSNDKYKKVDQMISAIRELREPVPNTPDQATDKITKEPKPNK